MVFGTEEQKKRILPDIIKGKVKGCFAVTEPDAGLNTTALETKAERDGNGYVVHGKKTWTTTAQVADKMLLIARTTPKDKCKRHTDGLSLFYTDFDRSKIEVREIEKMGRKAIDTNQVFIDGLKVPLEDRIGEEGKGFQYLLHGLNPERVLIAAEAIGIGKAALAKATQYAKERIVFGRPIGKNQAIQHPLAESWMQLEAANLLTFKAAWLYDNGKECGAEANSAKYLGARYAYDACERAILTHGGYGYAKEFHVERFLREVMIARIAPVSEQLILCYVAERVLGSAEELLGWGRAPVAHHALPDARASRSLMIMSERDARGPEDRMRRRPQQINPPPAPGPSPRRRDRDRGRCAASPRAKRPAQRSGPRLRRSARG